MAHKQSMQSQVRNYALEVLLRQEAVLTNVGQETSRLATEHGVLPLRDAVAEHFQLPKHRASTVLCAAGCTAERLVEWYKENKVDPEDPDVVVFLEGRGRSRKSSDEHSAVTEALQEISTVPVDNGQMNFKEEVQRLVNGIDEQLLEIIDSLCAENMYVIGNLCKGGMPSELVAHFYDQIDLRKRTINKLNEHLHEQVVEE